MSLFYSETFTRTLVVFIYVLFLCVSSTILHYEREDLLILQPDLCSGLSDRQGSVIYAIYN